jgi:hypothetical protein
VSEVEQAAHFSASGAFTKVQLEHSRPPRNRGWLSGPLCLDLEHMSQISRSSGFRKVQNRHSHPLN